MPHIPCDLRENVQKGDVWQFRFIEEVTFNGRRFVNQRLKTLLECQRLECQFESNSTNE